MADRLNIVTLYAAADREGFAAYERHLSALRHSGRIDHFHAGQISPGQLRAQLDDAIGSADVVVCLLSADFLADSTLVALAEQATDAGTLIPVRWRNVDLAPTRFAALQPMPRDGSVVGPDGRCNEFALAEIAATLGANLPERGFRDPHEELFERVESACRHKEDRQHPGARIRFRRCRVRLYARLLEVKYRDQLWDRQYVVAALPRTPVADDLAPLIRLLQGYRSLDPLSSAILVHLDSPAPPALRQRALEARIQIQTLTEYQGLIDFSTYLNAQNQRLAKDVRYPTSLYIPQRMVYSRGIEGRDTEAEQDSLTALYQWMLEPDLQRFMLVLGEFGVGKTFLLHELARRLGEQPGAPKRWNSSRSR